jgi:hypothetical protein
LTVSSIFSSIRFRPSRRGWCQEAVAVLDEQVFDLRFGISRPPLITVMMRGFSLASVGQESRGCVTVGAALPVGRN